MEIEELNSNLMEITESERDYRKGKRSGFGAGEPDRNADGYIELDDTLFSSRYYGTRIGRGRQPLALDSEFFMRKHSRFNPIPEHVHDYVEISYVYHGACSQLVNGSDMLLRENQVLLLDSACPHAINVLNEGDITISVCLKKRMLATCLDAARGTSDWLADFLVSTLDEQADHNRYVWFHSKKNRRIRRFFQEMMCEYLEPSAGANGIIRGLFQLIMIELMSVYESDLVRQEQERSDSGVSVIAILRHIQEYYLTCTLDSVAERFFVSPNYVSRLLKKSTGKTYMQLVQEQRLSHAAALLHTGTCSIEDAAHAVGYQNMSFFYRKFRELFGISPAECRTSAIENGVPSMRE